MIRDIGEAAPSLGMVVVIPSARTAEAEERRRAIRHTWLREEDLRASGVQRHYFVLGCQSGAGCCCAHVDGDMLSVPASEGFFNLVHKLLEAFEFVLTQALPFDLLLKADDDSFVNLPRLHEWALRHLKPMLYAGHPGMQRCPRVEDVPTLEWAAVHLAQNYSSAQCRHQLRKGR